MPAFPRVFYVSSDYVSHRRAGQGYQDLLERMGCLTDHLDDAQVVILHVEAPAIPTMLKKIPALGSRFCVGFTVWETDQLPAAYRPGLDAMDEVWTASSYTAWPLWRAGYAAFWLPHVTAEPVMVTPAARAQVDAWLGPRGEAHGSFDILHVTKADDPRKDRHAMEQAFVSFQRQHPHARLVVKTGCFGRPPTVRRSLGIIDIVQDSSDAVMAALRERCHLIASSHHSEGWGLTLSEAMAEGKITVAPAYSGNMTFMSHANSLLVPAAEVHVGRNASYFEAGMVWGQVAIGTLTEKLCEAYRLHQQSRSSSLTLQASRDMRCFSHQKVALLLRSHLLRIARILGEGWAPPRRTCSAWSTDLSSSSKKTRGTL